MADYDTYGGGDYTQRRQPREQSDYQPAPVRTSQTPTQVWEQPSTPEAPPQPSGSWGGQTPQQPSGGWGGYQPYYQGGSNPYGQGGQAPIQYPGSQQGGTPYQMGADFRYNQGGQANTQLGQYANRLEGFDTGKLNDPTRDSAKYMFGRLASRYAPTQQGFAQLMSDPEFQRLGMQSLGGGKVRLPNGDTVDVMRGFQSGGQGWQWGAETVNGQPAETPTPQTPQTQQGWYDQYTNAGYNPWAQGPQGQPGFADQFAQYQQQMNQYTQQMLAWQQQQQQQAPPQQAAPQQAPPPGYQNYGGTGYAQAYPGAGYAQTGWGGPAYNQGVTLSGAQGGASYNPYGPAFNYLSNGMPQPYNYGQG